MIRHPQFRVRSEGQVILDRQVVPDFPGKIPVWASLLPPVWDFRIAIHFTHRAMALVLAFALTWFAWTIRRDRASTMAMRAGASALVSLMVLQILLGAQIIWTLRKPEMTTSHVVVGALTLAVTFWLTWVAHRDRIEGPAPLATPSRA